MASPLHIIAADDDSAVSYLIKPVRLSNLEAALSLAVGHSRRLQALSREVDRLRQRI